MYITDIVQEDDKVSFNFHTSKFQYANLLRQILLSSIPTYAIDSVEFLNNTSMFSDEVIAHRIGLIPILWDGVSDLEGKNLELDVSNRRNVVSDDFNDEIVKPGILILRLNPGQNINVITKLSMGCGSKHEKWNAVRTVTFDSHGGYYKFELLIQGTIPVDKMLEIAIIEFSKKVLKF